MKTRAGSFKRVYLAAVLILLPWGGAIPRVAAQPVTDAEIKATLLFKFVPFVRWPKPKTVQADHFIFLIVGQDPFGPVIDHFEGQSIRGRPLKIVRVPDFRVTSEEPLPACDMVFISASMADQLDALLAGLDGKPILTVSDQAGWGARGVMINFFESEESVRFEINPQSTRASGIRIGAQLLKLSRIVK
ncbi:YfiR family protein [Acanthopleuribacter pedis]|uniref:YfiR family protein n=1 Tax=Acanthopleuribacter pedis TaxID=442870 RepID=A0A8J7QNT4_9BACT|nr:YfiR family protein [Acanthopleuribacter pedis]MBO1321848.1 YfiR family protein [Acanthopleuribacter pedis]